ncbi:hypothetical protein KDK95_33375, partial [Actinospica sp. MGRD01-02]
MARQPTVARRPPQSPEVAVPDRFTVPVGEQQRPPADRLDPLGQKIGKAYRQVDHPAAPALGRTEKPSTVHVFVHRAEPRTTLVDSRAHTRSRAHPAHLPP